jgi:hypothetical protein
MAFFINKIIFRNILKSLKNSKKGAPLFPSTSEKAPLFFIKKVLPVLLKTP